MSFKNDLIQRIVKLLQPPVPSQSSEKRFLILSTTGLGDTLWATPAIKALREKYPQNYIGILTSPIGKEVLEHHPHLDEIFVVKDPVFFQLFSLYQQLKHKNITHVFSFHVSQRPILPLAAILGAQEIIGTYGLHKGLDSLLTSPIPPSFCHEIERRLQLVKEMDVITTDKTMQLFLSKEDRCLNLPFLTTAFPLIGFHPGAKDHFKRWPKEHFIRLGQKLVHTLNCQIIVTGNPSEHALVHTIASSIPGAIAITNLKLRETAALIERLSLLITNDTGPMHIAFAMKTPTVALFTPTNPTFCGPYNIKECIVIQKQTTCTPCIKKKCQSPFCLLQIGIQEVYDAAIQLLKKPITDLS